MGYFQPGGAGTAITVYDDNDATGGHATGQPHTPAELNVFDPLVWPILQSPAGATFSASRRQYLVTAITTLGSTTVGNINQTTFDIKTCDVFCPSNRLQFSTANSALYVTFNMGTKIGTSPDICGREGGTLHLAAVANFRCNAYLYGSFISNFSGAAISFQNSGATSQEFGGTVVGSTTGGFNLGNADLGPLRIYNSAFSTNVPASSDVIPSSIFLDDAKGLIVGSPGPRSFLTSATAKKITRMQLVGAPADGDIRLTVSTGGWQFNELGWSNTPGKPRIRAIAQIQLANSNKEYISLDTKIVNVNGDSLQAVPVWVSTDIEGEVVDTQTGFDGNVVFTNPDTALGNAIMVRDHYSGPLSSPTVNDPLVRDRLVTITVNGIGGSFTANPSYETKVIRFQWPGRDRLGTGYVDNGGSFIKVMMPIMLNYGVPVIPQNRQEWDECAVDSL